MEIKDKPNSMSVREWITKKIATGILIPENVINKVISHQFISTLDAMQNNNSLEVSGFGKFYFNVKKAKEELVWTKEQKQLLEERITPEATEEERSEIESKLNHYKKKIKWLEGKKLEMDGETSSLKKKT